MGAVNPLVTLLLLAGCASSPPQPSSADPIAVCHEVFRRVDRAVAEAGVADGMAARVTGFPYLRVNRFLASYAEEELDDARFAEWMNRMVALGTHAWAIEIANLPVEPAEVLGHELWKLSVKVAWAGPALVECAGRVAAADLGDPARRAEIRAAARVPDDYVTWHRVAGLYSLTRIPFAQGVARWHREVHATFAPPLDALPVTGELKTYVPPPGGLSAAEAAAALARASSNALGVPDPRGTDLEALFRTYAPRFAVDTAGEADIPGEPGWLAGDAPRTPATRDARCCSSITPCGFPSARKGAARTCWLGISTPWCGASRWRPTALPGYSTRCTPAAATISSSPRRVPRAGPGPSRWTRRRSRRRACPGSARKIASR
jgi:hypothetical protein